MSKSYQKGMVEKSQSKILNANIKAQGTSFSCFINKKNQINLPKATNLKENQKHIDLQELTNQFSKAHSEEQSKMNPENQITERKLQFSEIQSENPDGYATDLDMQCKYHFGKQIQKSKYFQRNQKIDLIVLEDEQVSAKILFNKAYLATQYLDFISANTYIWNIIDKNKAYNCRYLLFLVALGYLLAEQLSIFDPQCIEQMYTYKMFKGVLLQIYKTRKQDDVLSEKEVTKHLSQMMKFKQCSPLQFALNLKDFLIKYQEKWMSFAPVYYYLFSFNADKYQLLKHSPSLQQEIQLKIKQILSKCKKKYHSDGKR